MRSLSQELLHQVGRAIVVYMLVALLAASVAIVQALIVSPQQTEQSEPADDKEPKTSGEPSAAGRRWIDPA